MSWPAPAVLLHRLHLWRSVVRRRHIEQQIEALRGDIEDAYLNLNALIREKSRLEIAEHRHRINHE